ncbi:14302_t:CDS:1 [Acaulospora colombiana]|uniref:14302_t:CDS:1 n=1 Tax=Acaulospora colombiana TaxID=27376 RepID=A0ACA9KLR9_9GLOM|nr:14302_t:CDS:1 [Acaulospora colombiana]
MKKGKLPFRPTNQFLLYRTALIKTLFKNGYYEYNMREISRLASKLWKLEPEYVQREYRILALKVKKIHREYELHSIHRNTLMNKVDVIRVRDSPNDWSRGDGYFVPSPNRDYCNLETPNFHNPTPYNVFSDNTLITHDAPSIDTFNISCGSNFEESPPIVYPIHNLMKPNVESFIPSHEPNVNVLNSYHPNPEPPVVYTIHNLMVPNIEQNNFPHFATANDVRFCNYDPNLDYYV